eukprot:4747535-Pleurochrysis_carterae.AAC.1
MEGFEHGNKLTKHVYLRRTSAGGRLNKKGYCQHRQAQALERRREGTVAAHELGLINKHSSLRNFLKRERLYEKKYDVTKLKHELVVKREELLAKAELECSLCEEKDSADAS